MAEERFLWPNHCCLSCHSSGGGSKASRALWCPALGPVWFQDLEPPFQPQDSLLAAAGGIPSVLDPWNSCPAPILCSPWSWWSARVTSQGCLSSRCPDSVVFHSLWDSSPCLPSSTVLPLPPGRCLQSPGLGSRPFQV